ncbi:peptide ligase PGM1-related protein [Mesoterricola silvestris]|uniref:ATP-grasp domain-containing protein n=1 Tax=Mesoterricola silvestris TaxID=2927979 RepID=A0AA48KAI5_9BACT|nr:peptide ligase PGM1-related protein [Mesoterricola silvestris]BDU74691.1 hypothetical protein METEAL_38650 [Mesoterricola silvestris]
MKKIVVGNVDCEAQCGDPTLRNVSERASSSRVANRMAWFLDEGDVFVTPYLILPEMMAYIGRFKGFLPGDVTQVFPGNDPADTVLITESLIEGSDLIERIRVNLVPGVPYGMISYFPDPGAGAIAQGLGLEVPDTDLKFMLDGRAAALSKKSLFRGLAEERDLRIPPGMICRTKEDLRMAISNHLARTGSVIVKQDLAGGGEGNVALTTELNRGYHPGAGQTLRIAGEDDLRTASEAVWSRYVDSRNTCLIVESFLLDAHPVYAEVDTRGQVAKVINLGSMRMDPTWVGFEYPVQNLAESQIAYLVHGSQAIGDACLRLGYKGLLNCDAVKADGSIYFHEVNVRYGGCSHLDAFCRLTLGEDYYGRHGIVTENRAPFKGTFEGLEAFLESEDLAFDLPRRRGVAIMTEDLARTGTFECLVVAESREEAMGLEDRLFGRALNPKVALRG